jgi:alkylated DNA repair dioxygenase AlkB
MKFTHKVETEKYHNIVLPRLSMLIMTDECRYDYKHEISKNTIDTGIHNGQILEIVRGRRVSLTFRYINVQV